VSPNCIKNASAAVALPRTPLRAYSSSDTMAEFGRRETTEWHERKARYMEKKKKR